MSYQQPPLNPYGQQPHGDYHAAPARTAGQRPGTVTFAAWLTIVSSGLTALLMILLLLVVVLAREPLLDALQADPELRDAFRVDDLEGRAAADRVAQLSIGFLAAFALWALLSLSLGIAVLRRSNVARVLLAISAGVCAGLTGLLAIALFLPAVWALTCVAVIVLLFVGGANDWFSG